MTSRKASLGHAAPALDASEPPGSTFGRLRGQPGLHPLLLPARVVLDVGVAVRRQHLGGLLGGVSRGTATVHDDLLVLIGQECGGESSHAIRREVDRSGKMSPFVLPGR